MKESDPRWEAFAAREPYYAVLPAARHLAAARTAEDERAFFASGETLVGAMFAIVEASLQPRFAPASALEYGCGIGRLAAALAARSGTVTAVDRSPAMRAAARAELARRGLDHVSVQAPDALAADARKFDLVCCYLVLQRMPPRDGLALLARLVRQHLGPGGIGVFHVPYHASTGAARRAVRALRTRLPGANALANLALGRPAAQPFVPTYTYPLDRAVRTLEAAGVDAMHVALERHDDLDTATLYVRMPQPPARAPASAPEPVDVKALIRGASLEQLNQSAEAYFAGLRDWDHHLAKPFSQPDEVPPLLVDVATLLGGLRPTAGMTTLEFGAGTGWLSRFLTQLGCRAVLLDVSPTALRMAEALYARQPVIGDRPPPCFLVFDGRRIDLPDASVDRIVVFHAFHHAPNPEELIAEFARVLRPGGIAGFAEPGPVHSRSPLSQFEMRTYGVIENDVDVHAIWRAASRAGFDRLELAAFHAPPFLVSLREYEDLLAGGPTGDRWLESTRGFLRHVRTFFLHKAGAAAGDSRMASGLAAGIAASIAVAEGRVHVEATVTNTGAATWLPASAGYGGVSLGAHLYDRDGKLVVFDAARQAVSDGPVPPGAAVVVRLALEVPAGAFGMKVRLKPDPTYEADSTHAVDPAYDAVELDCVADGVIWFAQRGSPVIRLRVPDGG